MRLERQLQKAPVTFFISLAALGCFSSAVLTQLLEINLQSEVWTNPVRVLGCHLLHWSAEHLAWDLGMFVVLGAICEQLFPKRFYATLFVAAAAIPVAIIFSNPEINTYRGLSGLDTAIFSLLATSAILERNGKTGTFQRNLFCLLLFGLWCKIAYECVTGQVVFVQRADFTPLAVSHLIGAVIGSVMAISIDSDQTAETEIRHAPRLFTQSPGNLNNLRNLSEFEH